VQLLGLMHWPAAQPFGQLVVVVHWPSLQVWTESPLHWTEPVAQSLQASVTELQPYGHDDDCQVPLASQVMTDEPLHTVVPGVQAEAHSPKLGSQPLWQVM
jgi:hypothetical protein